MAKFLKSIFQPTDRRKSTYENEAEEEKTETSPMGTKRQLSISRSGRMRQANKKRHSLALELYGETIQIDTVEAPKSIEYHVHSPSRTAPADLAVTPTTGFGKAIVAEDATAINAEVPTTLETHFDIDTSVVVPATSPEEEIDSAFEIIDKS
ncbi:uncharacterized protein LOC113494701 [Trichoplusia ni]|uniref:Uncharacterized protein LOC113494701 n=1 Tax=Trichoplusia ni TaxID=7111 RepID=A0A7E5VKS8_TRINI|nr:uncharacterized protein LOC113494701 [Trichoplusia ni]